MVVYFPKEEIRLLLYFVQFGHCIWCGEMMTFTRCKNGQPAADFATFEHIIPRVKGGRFDLSNIVLAHRYCNHKRTREGYLDELDQLDIQEDRP